MFNVSRDEVKGKSVATVTNPTQYLVIADNNKIAYLFVLDLYALLVYCIIIAPNIYIYIELS